MCANDILIKLFASSKHWNVLFLLYSTVYPLDIFQEEHLAIGGEIQDIEIHDIQREMKVQSVTGHETR